MAAALSKLLLPSFADDTAATGGVSNLIFQVGNSWSLSASGWKEEEWQVLVGYTSGHLSS